jgi:hypothetical protein
MWVIIMWDVVVVDGIHGCSMDHYLLMMNMQVTRTGRGSTRPENRYLCAHQVGDKR